MEHSCHVTCFGPLLACGWPLSNLTGKTWWLGCMCQSQKKARSQIQIPAKWWQGSPGLHWGLTCLSNLCILRLSYKSQNIGKEPRAGTILRAVPVFWDTTLEKPPVRDSLNALHTVSNVNKAQTRNVYIKIFHSLQYCRFCLHTGWKCYQANIFSSVDFMHQEEERI